MVWLALDRQRIGVELSIENAKPDFSDAHIGDYLRHDRWDHTVAVARDLPRDAW
jgi:hypothetical protein